MQIGTVYFDANNPDMCKKSDPSVLKQLETDLASDKLETFPTKIVIARRG